MPDNNGWKTEEKFVLQELKRLNDRLEQVAQGQEQSSKQTQQTVNALRELFNAFKSDIKADLRELQVKVGIGAMIAGAMASITVSIVTGWITKP